MRRWMVALAASAALGWAGGAASQESLASLQARAQQGSAQAQTSLGFHYERGIGVAKDPAQARYWYEKAAAQGDGTALHDLGVMYDDGNGVPKDPAKAVWYFRQAIDHGKVEAMTALGVHYINGDGVPKDTATGIDWYRKAAERGQADALYNLGSAYRGGKRLPLDLVEAYKFLEVSVARYPAGSSLAADTRTEADALGKQLTPAQLEDARRRAADYVNAHPGWPKVN